MSKSLLNYLVEHFHKGNNTKAAKFIGMKRSRFHFYKNGRFLKDWQIAVIREVYKGKLKDKMILDLISQDYPKEVLRKLIRGE